MNENTQTVETEGDGLAEFRKGLTPRQIVFAEEYALSSNATEAAQKAGYGAANDNSAAVGGWQLKRNRKVRAYIDALLDAYGASRGELIRNLSAVASSEWQTHIFVVGKDKEGGDLVKMDLRSLVEANKILMQARGMLAEKHEISGGVTIIRDGLGV